MARKNLQQRLAEKSESLWTEKQRQADASVAFIVASQNAEEKSRTAETQAKAVDTALDILAQAGVVL